MSWDDEFDFKKESMKVFNFLKSKTGQWILIGLLLALIIVLGTWIRVQNLPLLVDETSGEYIPLALDPFYFLRVAETMVSDAGLPVMDSMRYPSLHLGFTNEITPTAVVTLYKIANHFGDYTLRYIDVISPVIFFIIGLVIFFFLVYVLTNSKGIAVLASGLLSFSPAYLYRTMAGFADHESIGMMAFFSVILIYVLAMKHLEKEKSNLIKVALFSIGTGFLTFFTMISWGGAVRFVFMIIPLSFIVTWILKFKNEKKGSENYLLFYSLWVLSTVFFGASKYGVMNVIRGNMASPVGMISLFTLGFIFVDYFFTKFYVRKYLERKNLEKYQIFVNVFGTIVLGIIVLSIMGINVINLVIGMWKILLQPFGTERISLTVAENAQPYLIDWISQIGRILFWLSLAGIILIGVEFAKKISSKKGKIFFPMAWMAMVFGILFSRYSSASVFNGETFIGKGIYILGVLIFLIISFKVYFNEKIRVDSSVIILLAMMLVSVIAVRSASRVFFFIIPFACLSASIFIFRAGHYAKKNKEELWKWLLGLLVILAVIGAIYTLNISFNNSKNQAYATGPSATAQWQNAMAWVRNNTAPDSIFVHWWDYGYWVQTLGERATITDGGHSNSFWDHLIGRYVLTSRWPDATLSFMKAHEVDYLLIDQTDLGKYSAYSKIGGDENFDSFSIIPIGVVNDAQTQETSDSITRVYNLGGLVDEDIYYNNNGSEVFVPGPSFDKIGNPSFKASVAGVILKNSVSDKGESFNQPNAVFIYNNQQIGLPIRYIYYNGQLVDFGKGIESIVYLFPKINQNANGGISVDPRGAMIYLSPKVSEGLFAQLYLMDDPFGNYPTIKLAHAEPDYIVKSLRAQGLDLGEFVFFGALRGPIKIWEINYPSNIIAYEGFTNTSGEYAIFDDLNFTK